MSCSWNEARVRAAAFADDWRTRPKRRLRPRASTTPRRVRSAAAYCRARYEAHVAKVGQSLDFIDLFWPGVLIVEQKSAGRDLKTACAQAGEYFDELPDRERRATSWWRLPSLRASRSRRAGGRRVPAGGPARACRGIRLRSRLTAPDVPRSGLGKLSYTTHVAPTVDFGL